MALSHGKHRCLVLLKTFLSQALMMDLRFKNEAQTAPIRFNPLSQAFPTLV